MISILYKELMANIFNYLECVFFNLYDLKYTQIILIPHNVM
jgi:hypothetical protein